MREKRYRKGAKKGGGEEEDPSVKTVPCRPPAGVDRGWGFWDGRRRQLESRSDRSSANDEWAPSRGLHGEIHPCATIQKNFQSVSRRSNQLTDLKGWLQYLRTRTLTFCTDFRFSDAVDFVLPENGRFAIHAMLPFRPSPSSQRCTPSMLLFKDVNGRQQGWRGNLTWLQQIAATLPPSTGWFRPNILPGGPLLLLASSNVSRFIFLLVPCPPQRSHRQVKSSFMLATDGLTL